MKTKSLARKDKNCSYPKCKTEQCMKYAVPLMQKKLEGKLEYVMTGQTINTIILKVCYYHWIVIGGGQFYCVKDPMKESLEFCGPFRNVELVESVMAAREVTRKEQPKDMSEYKRMVEDKKNGKVTR